MTSRNPTENDLRAVKPTPAEAARKDEKADKPSEIKRELTDEEIEAVAGGATGPFPHGA
jgi:hypothetical protein